MKILLIRNDNIGDLVCTTPAIEALRKVYQNSQIDIVVNSLNSFVVKNNPFLNTVFVYTKTKHKKRIKDKIVALFKKGRLLFRIYFMHYDVVIVFRDFYSQNAALFAKASKAKIVISVDDTKNPKAFINKKVDFIKDMHEVRFCFELLKPLGIRYMGEKTLFIPDKRNEEFKEYIFFPYLI